MMGGMRRSTYRVPAIVEKDVKLISKTEYKARDMANGGWTVVAAGSFLLATIQLAAGVAPHGAELAPGVIFVGAVLCFSFALFRKREHFAVMRQYWSQPGIDEKKED